MSKIVLIGLVVMLSPLAEAFEHTKVLPKGVRSINFRRVDTSIESKTDSKQQAKPLADPLEKDVKFSDLTKGGLNLKSTPLRHSSTQRACQQIRRLVKCALI